MSHTITTTQSVHPKYPQYRMWTYLVFGAFLLSIVLYVSLVISTTIHISEQKSAEDSSRTLLSEIAELEMKYFQASNTIDLDTATAYGFTDATETHFAYSSNTELVDEGISVAQR